MRWFALVTVLASCGAGLLLSGCSQQPQPRVEQPSGESSFAVARRGEPPLNNPGRPDAVLSNASIAANATDPTADALAAQPPESTTQEKYDAALLDALDLLAERNYDKALVSLAAARGYQDTEQIRREIDKVKNLIIQQASVQQTAQDIQTVITAGKSEEAAQLAATSLQQFGATDDAAQLARLKRQADALTASQIADQAARRARFRQEGEAAMREKNPRAAAIAFEQALQCGDDAELQRQLDAVRASLAAYDEKRQRAAELRRDPANLEQAIALLQEAAQAWDTLQVREEIDLYALAMQKRRERISVADFEVTGDIGFPFAGRAVAEELLPAFKPRFNLVERSQIGKIINELQLEANELVNNANGQREVGHLANIRYLVVGSISRFAGITVHARLVDVKSGLVVQTAKLVVATPEEFMVRVPRLANVLMMTDEQKFAYEQQLAQQAAVPVAPAMSGPLPPPPEIPIAAVPMPPPVVVYTPRPPDLGGACAQDFDRLPPPPPPGRFAVAAEVIVARNSPAKQRFFNVAVELGDNLFKRGRYQEAHSQFQLALSLSPHHQEISLRIERCRPCLPPPPPPVIVAPAPVVVVPQPVVVVAPAPVIVAPPPVVVVAVPPRPRIAILNFVVNADPSLAPPGMSDWAAEQLACHFTPSYQVVDRGEVFWYMGRLGMTVRDVLCDASARLWLGRALNVRFFVVGLVQQTASFNVTTHLVDVETGSKQGTGSIHVQDHQELKLRMHELAGQVKADPVDQNRLQQETQENERQLNQARQFLKNGQPAQAAEVCQAALKTHPNNVGMKTLLQQAEQQLQQQKFEAARQREAEQRQAEMIAAQKRQQELARAAETARHNTEKMAAAQNEAGRRAQEDQKQKAYNELVAQGKSAQQQGHYQRSVQLLESAVALKPNDAASKDLAQAKAKAEDAARVKKAEEQIRQTAELQTKREAEMVQARAKVEEQRRQRETEEQVRRKAQEARDQAAYDRLVEDGRKQLAQKKYDAAVAALQSARQLRKTDEVEKLLKQAEEQQARTEAEKKGAQAKADLERRLAEEKAVHARAEAEAKRKQEAYTAALKAAQQAFAEKRYDQAISKYQEAGKLFPTDVALNGQRQAEEARARDRASAVAEKRKEAEKAKNNAATLQAELAKKRDAEKAKAEAAAQQAELAKKRDAEKAKAEAAAQQAELPKKRDAEKAKATAAAQQAELAKKREADLQAKAADSKKRQADYETALRLGREAMNAKRYDDAIKSFNESARLQPGDATAAALLQQAQKAKSDAQAVQDAEARKRQEEEKRRTEFKRLMAQGQAAATAKRWEEAVKLYGEALKLQPGDPAATKALGEATQALQASKVTPPKPMTPPATQPQPPVKPMPAPAVQPAPKPAPVPTPMPAAPPKPMPPTPPPTPPAKPMPPTPPIPPQARPVPQPATVPPPLPPAAYVQQMQAAAAFEKQQKYPEAIKAYQEALRLVPNDAKATASLKGAQFAGHMFEGRKAAIGKRFPDAIREFEEALKLSPNNPEATSALKRARDGKP